MTTLFWTVGIYVAIGIAVTVILSQTPYSDNPWWLTTLLWPLFIWGLLR